MTDLQHFRQQVRAWLEQNCPPAMRNPQGDDAEICWGGRGQDFRSEAQQLWVQRLGEKGWTVPEWPREYGGGGLDRTQHKVLKEEMQALGCSNPLISFGVSMLGPALLQYGSEEQKREHLPKIARAEIRWCQGYSEPGAGSDLASLQTKAQDQGDYYLVNGQKVWTSYADKADWIFCLVRTSSDGPVQRGISFLLFDMRSEGVSTRPIKLISGESPFCETFFDNVKVPKHQLMGELGKGWSIAKYLLTHEREMISSFGGDDEQRPDLVALAKENIGTTADGQLDDSVLRAEVARLEIELAAFAATMERSFDESKAGQSIGAKSSMLKYLGTELNKKRYELLMELAGSEGLAWGDAQTLAPMWLRTKGNSIEGGTSEIQLNVVAKQMLELPSR